MTDKQWDEVMKLDSHLEDRKIAGGPNWETMEVLGSGACAYTEKVFPNTFDAELGKALFARVRVINLYQNLHVLTFLDYCQFVDTRDANIRPPWDGARSPYCYGEPFL